MCNYIYELMYYYICYILKTECVTLERTHEPANLQRL